MHLSEHALIRNEKNELFGTDFKKHIFVIVTLIFLTTYSESRIEWNLSTIMRAIKDL